jgi:hypothetical protein
MQNYTQDQGIMAPNRAASSPQWGGANMNEVWQFAPAAGTPLFKRTELYNPNGVQMATADTTGTSNGVHNIRFTDVCFPFSGNYYIKTTYADITDPTKEVYVVDTFHVTQQQPYSDLHYASTVYCKEDSTSMIQPLFSGTAGGTYTVSPAGLVINPQNGVITLAATDTGRYTITYTVPGNGGSCAEASSTTELIIASNTYAVWTGAVNNAWENPGNWSCNQVPGPASNVHINIGQVIISSSVTINSLLISPGAGVLVTQGNNLTVTHPN